MMGTLVVKGLRGDLILRLREVELISNSSLISLKPLIFNDYEMFIIVILQSFTLLLLQSYLIRHLIIRSTFKDTQRYWKIQGTQGALVHLSTQREFRPLETRRGLGGHSGI